MKGPVAPHPYAAFRPALQKSLAAFDKGLRRTRNGFYQLFPPKGRDDLFSAGSQSGVYSPGAGQGASGLSPGELKTFQRDGWIGPFPLLSAKGIKAAEKTYYRIYRKFRIKKEGDFLDPDFFKAKPWLKSMQAHVPEYYDIARHPAIVERVASLLGPDLIAWSLVLNLYRPGEFHRWHVDVEHRRWKGVTVFLGLRNITPKSTLKVISRSHRMDKIPQELGIKDDESALAACRKADQDAALTAVPLGEGDFFIFDGPLWHGSKNETFRTRGAMIIQYCRPDQKIEIPMTLDPPVLWHPVSPSCVLVKGVDHWGVNRMAERPGGLP